MPISETSPWRAWLERMAGAESVLDRLADPGDPQARAEVHRLFFAILATGYQTAFADPDHPDFVPSVSSRALPRNRAESRSLARSNSRATATRTSSSLPGSRMSRNRVAVWVQGAVAALILTLILGIGPTGVAPFIYFQF